jgi:hypothetical protein
VREFARGGIVKAPEKMPFFGESRECFFPLGVFKMTARNAEVAKTQELEALRARVAELEAGGDPKVVADLQAEVARLEAAFSALQGEYDSYKQGVEAKAAEIAAIVAPGEAGEGEPAPAPAGETLVDAG